MLTKL
jgi:hypothetical protein